MSSLIQENTMKNQKNQSRAEELTGLLMKLNSGDNKLLLQKEANRLIGSITPGDIAEAENRLLQNGYTINKIQQLSSAFVLMGILENSEHVLPSKLPDNHILRKVLAEHDMLRCFLADLEDVVSAIQQMDSLTSTNSEFMRLSHITEHLNGMLEHMQREDDVLFPGIRDHGWKSLFSRVESEHVYIQMSISDLVKLVTAFGKIPFISFKTRLVSTVRYLCPLLRDHLFYEDRVLFPLAVSMVEDGQTWNRLRRICNEIDYCGIHL